MIMKIRSLIFAFALAMMPVVALADMTDSQILEYIAKEQAKGTDQNEIAQQLMKKGVSVKQLQRVKEKYGKAGSSNNKSKSARGTEIVSRTRGNNNNSTMQQTPAPVNGMGRVKGLPGRNGRFDEQDGNFMQMQGMIGEMNPDSTMMYVMPEEGPKVFGRDIFRNEMISFEPNMNIATPSNYVLGAGDVLYIDVYGASQSSIEVEVSPDGKIVVEDYGPISVGGMNIDAASRRIKSKLGGVYADSQFSITLGQTRSIQVNVMGEVAVPGSYTLSAFASVFHALYYAGGVSDIGSLREVKLIRDGKVISTFDLYDYILNGNMSDVRLQDNDAIVVSPYLALVNVAGKAKRPMYYEMKPTESVGQALKYAGGFASDAYTKTLRLMRKSGGSYSVHNISADNMDSFMVADGDSLAIDSVVMRYSNMVEVKGAVFHPGMYELGTDVKSVKTLVEYAAGLTETAMANRAVIQRMRADRTIETVRVDLSGILEGTAADVTLKNEDVLFIPNQAEFKQDQTMSIFGDVYEPGVYQFAYNTTVEDLVLQAGGLLKSASNQVKVSRRQTDRNATIANANRAEVFTFTLKDNFEVNGSDDFVLEPYDEVYVLRSPTFSSSANVVVEGEVSFPGTYSLNQNTRVSEVLEMCGGVTSLAGENGVYVLRTLTEDELRTRQLRFDQDRYLNAYNIESKASQVQAGYKALPISDSLLVERYMREDIYKVAVDLKKILKKPGCDEDLVLRDGDRIVVEQVENTVKLGGNVAYRGAVPYVKGKRLAFYLRQGGVPASARNIRMSYLVGPNGKARASRRFMKVEPGSEVVLRQDTEPLANSQKVTLFTTAASALATVAAVVVSVLK